MSQRIHCDAEAKSGCEHCTYDFKNEQTCQAHCINNHQKCKRKSVLGPVPMCRQHMNMIGLRNTLTSLVPDTLDIKQLLYAHNIYVEDIENAELTYNRVRTRASTNIPPAQYFTLTFMEPKHVTFKFRQTNGKITIKFTTIKMRDLSEQKHLTKFEFLIMNTAYTPLKIKILRWGNAYTHTFVPNIYEEDSGNWARLIQHNKLSQKIAIFFHNLLKRAFRIQENEVKYHWDKLRQYTTQSAYITSQEYETSWSL